MNSISDALRASVIHRLVSEDNLGDLAAVRYVDELEKFLAFCAANPGERYTPSDPVDRAWHALIAHTIGYREYCADLTGGSFIDHTPPRSIDEGQMLIGVDPV